MNLQQQIQATSPNGTNGSGNGNGNGTPTNQLQFVRGSSPSIHNQLSQISNEMYNQLKKELNTALQEKERAITVMRSYEKALNSEIGKRKSQSLQASLFKSHSSEDHASLIKKNQLSLYLYMFV